MGTNGEDVGTYGADLRSFPQADTSTREKR